MTYTAHPTLPGVLFDETGFGDTPEEWPVTSSVRPFESAFVSLRIDTIMTPSDDELHRTVLEHNGAVGVLAIDDDDRVMVVDQYRHAVGRRLFELPAGILDAPGEAPVAAAARELSEEADLVADEWAPLLTMYATPGCSTEHWQVFVARQLSATPTESRLVREGEEADMRQLWIPLSDLVAAVLEGRINDSMTVSAVLAAELLRRGDR